MCVCVRVGGQACPHTGGSPHSADGIQVTRSPFSTRWLQALQTHHFLGASSGLRSSHRILTTTLGSGNRGPILLGRNLRLREAKACQRSQEVQAWGYHPGPHLTPWPPGATLSSASVVSDSISLLEHSPPPLLVLPPCRQSRLRWPWLSPEDGGLSLPLPWTLYLRLHHPVSH